MQLNDLLLPIILFALIKNNIDEKKRTRLMHESRTQNVGLNTIKASSENTGNREIALFLVSTAEILVS